MGAGLSGIVAVGAAFLAAWLARRHDRRQEGRQAAARLIAVADDVGHRLLFISDQRDYPSLAGYRIFELGRAVVREMPYLGDLALYDRCIQIIDWLKDVWLPELRRTVDLLPAPDPDEDIGPRVVALADAGQTAFDGMIAILTYWQATGIVDELDPIPDLEDLESVD